MIAENVWWITKTVNTLKRRSLSSKKLETTPLSSVNLKLGELIKSVYTSLIMDTPLLATHCTIRKKQNVSCSMLIA